MIAHLDDRAVVRIAGPDASTLLQNVLTLDMAGVDRHGSGYGALLMPQGKILLDFVLHRQAGGYATDVRADQAEAFAKRLSLYRLRAKVEIGLAPELAVFVDWGDGSSPAERGRGTMRSMVEGANKGEEPDARQNPSPSPSPQGGGARPHDPRLLELGNRWIAPVGSVETNAFADDWHAHRIARAIPEGGIDFVFGDAFPHDAAMDALNGVAFEKGCYVGQEVVSRMRHRGTARRRIVALEADGKFPEPGAEITAEGRPLGRLGSSADGRVIGLVRLDRTRAAMNEHLPIRAGTTEVAVSLPAWATYSWPETVAAED